MEHAAWPAVLVSWKSKSEEFLKALGEGRMSPIVHGKMHLRDGARFVALLDDGRLCARGVVARANRTGLLLSIDRIAGSAEQPTHIEPRAVQVLKAAVAHGKRPLLAFPVPVAGEAKPFSLPWFDGAYEAAGALPAAAVDAPPTEGPPATAASGMDRQ